VTDLLEHLAQFAVAALDENDFVPGIVALANLANPGWRGVDLGRAGLAAFNGHTAAQDVEFRFRRLARDFHKVGFLNTRGSFGELVGQLAVVGHHQQAFAQVVEAADGIKPLAHLLKELHHRVPALRIFDGGNKSARLIEDEIAEPLRTLQQLAVNADVVATRVCLGAERGHNFAVDLHSPLLDHLFGLASAGHAGLSENFLQPLKLSRWAGQRLGLLFVFGGINYIRIVRRRGFAVGDIADWI
jgi:hypothetical protein